MAPIHLGSVCTALPRRTFGRNKNDEKFSRYAWRNARLRCMDSNVFQNSLTKSKTKCQHTQKTKKQSPRATKIFSSSSTTLKKKEKTTIENFVSFWDENKSKNAFEELRKNASAGFTAAGYRTQAELANPYVKIGVIADVHGNLNALEAVLEDAKTTRNNCFLKRR